MAQDNREYKADKPPDPPRPNQAQPATGQYNDHPFLGNDDPPETNRVLQFPSRPAQDPMSRLPSDPARDAERAAFESQPHDPSIDYHPPAPVTVIPTPTPVLRIVSVIAALLVFTLVALLMFHNWMTPAPRHPGEQKQGQGLEQKLP